MDGHPDGRKEPVDGVNIDYLILADWAEVINGKIYVQGGGWTTINAREPLPVSRTIAIAVSPRVEWHETNAAPRSRYPHPPRGRSG